VFLTSTAAPLLVDDDATAFGCVVEPTVGPVALAHPAAVLTMSTEMTAKTFAEVPSGFRNPLII
jgi:hypothetical protein